MRIVAFALVLSLLFGCTEELENAKPLGIGFTFIQTSKNIGRQVNTLNFTEANILNLTKTRNGNYTFHEINYVSPINFFQRDHYLTRTEITASGDLLNRFERYHRTIFGSGTIDAVEYFSEFDNSGDFIELIDFGAEFDEGRIFAGNGIRFEVEIRFGPGITQKAHRFTVPVGETDDVPYFQYTYRDYVEVPFQVWDITNNRQLMVSFRDQGRDDEFNLIELNFNSAPPSQSWEVLFIHDDVYSESENPNFPFIFGVLYESALIVWPVLPEGGNWDPDNLPLSKLSLLTRPFRKTIDFNPRFTSQTVYDYDRDSEELTISDHTFDDGGNPLTYVMGLNKNLAPQRSELFTSEVVNNQFSGSMGIKNTADGGTLLATRLGTGIRIIKTDSEFVEEYRVTNILPPEGDIIPWTEFIERDGNYYFFIYAWDRDSETGTFYFYQLEETGANLLSTFTPSSNPLPPLSHFVEEDMVSSSYEVNPSAVGPLTFRYFTTWKSFTVIMTTSSEVYFLDENFDVVGSPIIIPGFDNIMPQNQLNIYKTSNALYVTGFPEAEPSKLLIHSLDESGIIQSGVVELTDNMESVQHLTTVEDDGSMAHLALIETSNKSRELIFFRTDPSFELILGKN